MAIFSRREEIDMMKSIGADKHFIRGPFLIEAEMYGVFAALIAVTLGYVGFMSIIPALESADFVVAPARALLTDWWWVVMLGMVAVGMMIGYVSAWLAVRRYLKA
jgi:cell division transport system permease protein